MNYSLIELDIMKEINIWIIHYQYTQIVLFLYCYYMIDICLIAAVVMAIYNN